MPPSMTMFYFIGTGKQLKEEIARRKLSADYVREIASFKRRTSGIITGSMLLYVISYLSGGAADTGKLLPAAASPWIHLGLSVVTLFALGISAVRQISAIGDNVRLILRVADDSTSHETT